MLMRLLDSAGGAAKPGATVILLLLQAVQVSHMWLVAGGQLKHQLCQQATCEGDLVLISSLS